MAHGLSEFSDGKASFADAREVAWHRLGTTFNKPEGEGITWEEAVEATKCDITVRQEPLVCQYGEVPGKYLTLTNHPETGEPHVLHVSGERYEPYQNSDCFNLVTDIIRADQSGSHIETVGMYDEFRKFFVTVEVPEGMFVIDPKGANDVNKLYVAVVTSHDQTLATTACITQVRIVCKNTSNYALKNAKSKVTFKHTKNQDVRASQATTTLGLAVRYSTEFADIATQLFQTKVDNQKFFEIIKKFDPRPEDTEGRSNSFWEKRVDAYFGYFSEKKNQPISNTGWGAYNALTEYLDHGKITRGDGQAHAEASIGFRGTMDAKKKKALYVTQEVLELV